VPEVAVGPAEAEAGGLDGGDTSLQRLRAPGAQREVRHPRRGRLRQLQAVPLVVAPAPQEDRLTVARLDLHAQDVDEEAQALLGLRGQQLRMADVRDLVQRRRRRHVSSTIARSPSSS
jgi:hypothetical protein